MKLVVVVVMLVFEDYDWIVGRVLLMRKFVLIGCIMVLYIYCMVLLFFFKSEKRFCLVVINVKFVMWSILYCVSFGMYIVVKIIEGNMKVVYGIICILVLFGEEFWIFWKNSGKKNVGKNK